MQPITLTYDILKAAQPDLRKRYQEYVPKMWITRKMFEPEFDTVSVTHPLRNEHIATVNLSVIERGAGYNTSPPWYTKIFHYGIFPNGIIERMNTTTWGQMPEAVAYMGATSEWTSALRFPEKKVASTVPVPEPPPTVASIKELIQQKQESP